MLKVFWILTDAELRALIRARVSLFWIFIFPIIFLGMMMFSYSGGGAMAGRAVVEIVDHDKTPASARYIDTLTRTFRTSDTVRADVQLVAADSKRHEGAVRLILPKGLGAAIADDGQAVIQASYGAAGNISTQVAARMLDPITTRFNADLSNMPMPLKVELARANVKSPINFAQYLLTGVLIMSMMSAGMNATAVTIADHRERNTFKLMSCLPLSPSAYIGAILASRVIILISAAAFLVVCARLVFGITVDLVPIRLLNATVVLVVGNLMLLSMGLALSSRMSSVTTAVFVCNIVYLVLLFFSDLTMPLSALPGNIRNILQEMPTAHFVAALRATLIQGSSLSDQLPQILIMLAWGAGFLAVARSAFHWHRV